MPNKGLKFDHFYDKARERGRNHQDAVIYAAQKYIETLFEKNGLVEDDKLQCELAEDAFRKYSKEKNLGHSHASSWNATSKWIREMITSMEEETKPSTRRRAGAFDTFDDIFDALPKRGDSFEQETRRPKAREPRYAPESSRDEPRFARDEPGPRRPPWMPAGKGEYHFPEPEYPGGHDPWADDEYDQPAPDYASGFKNGRAPPPKPAGKGEFMFPEPEYPSSSGQRPKARYERWAGDSSKPQAYNAREYRPRHEEPRTASPPPQPYHESARPRYETREPPSSSSKARPPPRYETRDPPPSSSRRPRGPPSVDEDLDLCLGPKPKVCFYVVLGITKSASVDEIKKAYRKMSLKHHPDRAGAGGKTVATNKMAEINQANDVLSDPLQRHHYDETGRFKSR